MNFGKKSKKRFAKAKKRAQLTKESQKEDLSSLRPRWASRHIINPSPFLEPISIHVIYGDFCISDTPEYNNDIFSTFNNYKRVNNVSLCEEQRMIVMHLEDKQSSVGKNWRLLVHRLRSKSNSAAKDLSDLIEKYCQRIEAIYEDPSIANITEKANRINPCTDPALLKKVFGSEEISSKKCRTFEARVMKQLESLDYHYFIAVEYHYDTEELNFKMKAFKINENLMKLLG